MLADPQDAAALVEGPVDQLAVETGMVGVADLLDHKIEILLQLFPGGLQLVILHAHDDDLVDRGGPVVFGEGVDIKRLGQGLSPALDLAVSLCAGVPLEKGVQVFIAVGDVLCLHGAEDAPAVEGLERRPGLFLRHGMIVDHLVADRDVAARACHDSVKSIAEQGGEHGVISAGAQKDQVALCLSAADGLEGAVGRCV